MAPNPETIDYGYTPENTYSVIPPTPSVIIDAVYAERLSGRTAPIGNDGVTQSVVTNVENFEAMAQAEMSVRVASFSPAMASEYSVAWSQFSRSIESASEALSSERAAAGADGFEGDLADKVRETHTSFVSASTGLGEVVGSPSGKLDNFGGTLGLVQSTLGMVPLGGALTTPGVLAKPDPRAVAIMETVYSPAVMHAGDRLPALPGPINLAFDAGGSASDGSGSDGSGSGGSASDGSASPGGALSSGGDAGSPRGTDGAAGAGGTAAGEGDATSDPAGPNGEDGAVPAGGGPVERPGDDAAIRQAGLAGGADAGQATGAGGQSGRGVAPGGMGAGGIGAGGAGMGGLAAGPVPMSGSGGGGSGGPATGARGAPSQGSVGGPGGSAKGALPRGPGMGAAGAGEPGVNNAMSGRRGMGGGMMGGPGAGRARGEEDDGYTPAEFLTTIDNGDKLIGPLPRVVHPVIGAWS